MRPWSFRIPILSLVVMLAGCSAADLVNVLVPETGFRVVKDLRFGADARQTLDLYIPETPSKDLPTIVFFYGGNWQRGAKEDYLFAAEAFASRGYVTAVPDYRLYPEARFPAFLEDAAAAVDWLRNRTDLAETRGKSVYLVGHSAGAYITAMLALDPRCLEATGNDICSAVAAAVGLAGPYDFLPLKSETLKDIFGPRSGRAQTQPINFANGAASPPMLLISGLNDRTVFPRNSRRLAARLRDTGGRADLRLYEDTGHVGLIAALAKPFRGLAPTLDDTDRFLREHRRSVPCTAARG